MNCDEFKKKFNSDNLEMIRECYSDGPTILLTILLITILLIISFLSNKY